MNLLIVDDEWISLQGLMMGVHWEVCGIENVFEAYNVSEAKKVIEENEIQIVLCDIEMPGGSGLELIRWIRDKYGKMECLFLTCHADFKYAREAIRLGCSEYLVKPVPFQEVEEVVKRIVDKVKMDQKKEQLATFGKNFIDDRIKNVEIQHGKRINSMEILSIVDDYVIKHLNQDIMVEEIAKLLALHPDYLSRLIKKETGKSINRYIIEKKMSIAACMLEETNISANVIAVELGYANYPSFVKMFKKIYDISPTQYRQNLENSKKSEKNNM